MIAAVGKDVHFDSVLITFWNAGSVIAHFVYSCSISRKRFHTHWKLTGYVAKWQPKCAKSHLARQVNAAFQTWAIQSASSCSLVQRGTANCWGCLPPDGRETLPWTEAWEKVGLIFKTLPLPQHLLLPTNQCWFYSVPDFCHKQFQCLITYMLRNTERTVVLNCSNN